MEELLRQILEELRADDSPAWWLEVLRILGPLAGGALVAGIGFFAVHQQNKTQRETLDKTTTAQADQQRMDRLTDWRRERYGELLAAFGEFYAAVRGLNAAITSGGQDQARQERIASASNHLHEVNRSSRLLQAASKVADREIDELARHLVSEYYSASGNLIALGITAQLPRDENVLLEASRALARRMEESSERIYELNRRIEELISAGS